MIAMFKMSLEFSDVSTRFFAVSEMELTGVHGPCAFANI